MVTNRKLKVLGYDNIELDNGTIVAYKNETLRIIDKDGKEVSSQKYNENIEDANVREFEYYYEIKDANKNTIYISKIDNYNTIVRKDSQSKKLYSENRDYVIVTNMTLFGIVIYNRAIEMPKPYSIEFMNELHGQFGIYGTELYINAKEEIALIKFHSEYYRSYDRNKYGMLYRLGMDSSELVARNVDRILDEFVIIDGKYFRYNSYKEPVHPGNVEETLEKMKYTLRVM